MILYLLPSLYLVQLKTVAICRFPLLDIAVTHVYDMTFWSALGSNSNSEKILATVEALGTNGIMSTILCLWNLKAFGSYRCY